jgi:RNA polymerase sigma-70 factor (ECF subfamily)
MLMQSDPVAVGPAPSPAPAPAPDLELAAAVAAGDRGAFGTLMRRHNRLLYRTARSILKDDSDAEDALQNAYLHVYREIGKFRGEAKLSTWLTRIVINEALGSLRKRSRAPTALSLEGSELDEALAAASDPARSERPDELLLRADVRRALQARIDELPLAYRTVFVLRAVEEMSVTEASAALGVPEATIRTRYFRARERLRRALGTELDGVCATALPFGGARCDAMVARVLAMIACTQPRCLPA